MAIHTWSRRQLLHSAALGLGALARPARPGGARAPSSTGASDDEERLRWFLDARFGLFVHWGPYSIAGVEASWPIMVPELVQLLGPDQAIDEAEYVALADRFDPRDFDADAWVRFARQGGMRYLVFTSKHHDGYCMFDAPGTEYKINRSPYGRDLLAELAEACARDGLPLGLYYSPPDMHHPGYRDTSRPVRENWQGEPDRPQWNAYLDTMEAQLRKLLSDYGEVAVLWFDGLFEHDKYDPPRFRRLVQELSPRTLVNDRLGSSLADFVTPEQAVPEGIPVRPEEPAPPVTADAFRQFVDLLTSGASQEQIGQLFAAAQRARFPTEPLPPPQRFQPWEACITLGATWAFDPLERALKSSDTIVRTLVEVASRGGNLLLNVGPTPRGTFPAAAEERLRAVRAWLDLNGESIYATTYGPLQGVEGLRTTARDGKVFVHLIEPRRGSLRLDLDRALRSARLLADGTPLALERNDAAWTVALPDLAASETVSVLELSA